MQVSRLKIPQHLPRPPFLCRFSRLGDERTCPVLPEGKKRIKGSPVAARIESHINKAKTPGTTTMG
ncbi:rCG42973 [Rattus norvegicus]|uniref:RCG42973 n=1 Tax=Rattus norvegicus TaxID=10116 RepID=A6IW25_RAT|nr:rCG42973 [Rattus norvegicus]